MNIPSEDRDTRAESLVTWALASAILGLVALAIVYWMVLPAVVFGLIGVVIALRVRRRLTRSGARDRAMAAICLGAVAVLFTPVVLMQTSGAEDWGRDCALDPDQDPNCPDN